MARPEAMWVGSPIGWVKFNIDGVFYGSSGKAKIEVILRDHEAVIKVMFSKSMGLRDSNLVEVLAIKEAFVIFTNATRFQKFSLWIESDSQNLVMWTNNPKTAP